MNAVCAFVHPALATCARAGASRGSSPTLPPLLPHARTFSLWPETPNQRRSASQPGCSEPIHYHCWTLHSTSTHQSLLEEGNPDAPFDRDLWWIACKPTWVVSSTPCTTTNAALSVETVPELDESGQGSLSANAERTCGWLVQILVDGSDLQPRVEVLLVTDRKGRALVFPKGGCNDRDRGAKSTAAREAMEEAGVRGKLRRLSATPKYTSKRKGIKVKGSKVSSFFPVGFQV